MRERSDALLRVLERVGERHQALLIGHLQPGDRARLIRRGDAGHEIQPRDQVFPEPRRIVVVPAVGTRVVLIVQRVLQRDRQPHVSLPVGPHPDESWRRDADHRHRDAVDDERLPDCRVAGAHHALPESIADHGD